MFNIFVLVFEVMLEKAWKAIRGEKQFDPGDPDSVIASCRSGNAAAQHALIKLYYGYVKNIARRYSSDLLSVEEIINDSFLKVLTNLDKYDDKQSFKKWMATITINTAIDYYRKELKIPEHNSPYDVHLPDMNEDIISRISAEEILSLVGQLSPAYRMVFSLYVIDGYSHREIAGMLGIQEGTSKSNLMDARRKLQTMILNRNTR